jgi:hypothetical protein
MIFLAIFILLVIAVSYLQSPSVKGKLGESNVNRAIHKKLNKNEYHLLKDVTLPIFNHTTQIDHIVVSRYGIFVIETKNMKGWIFGGQRQKNWTQSIYKKKYQFQNPLRQNYKHIKTLAQKLDLAEDKFHSIIVFTGKSTFMTKMPENVLDSGYIEYIKSKDEVLFSDSAVYQFIEKIERLKLERTRKTNRTHIAYLKEHHNT